MTQSAELAATACAHRVPMNVGDKLVLCDFHVPVIVRGDDLAVSISTCGARLIAPPA